jgi:hypothetical protein
MSQLRKSSRLVSHTFALRGTKLGQFFGASIHVQLPDAKRSVRPWLFQLTSKPFRSSSSVTFR